MTTDPYPLRAVTETEFTPWARMIADVYGLDRSDEELAIQRSATDLSRTLGVFDGGTPVGAASIYRRELTVPGALLPVAGIASVAVPPTHRRRGILTSMMRRQLTDLHDTGGEPVAALRPAEAGIYGRYGYSPASYGNQLRCDKRAMIFRPGTDFGDGTIGFLDRAAARPVLERVYDEVRSTAVGWPDRDDSAWDLRLHDPSGTTLRFAVHTEPRGRVSGYALYHWTNGEDLELLELAAVSRQAHTALWRFVAEFDLVKHIRYEAAVDDPLPHQLVDPRATHPTVVDRLWVRLVDVDRALAARRYAAPMDLVLDVEDSFCPWNTGRFRLAADGDTASCEPTAAPADLRLSAAELGSAYLGGTGLASLAAAGLVRELRPGALARANAAFATHRAPFYPGGWAFPLY